MKKIFLIPKCQGRCHYRITVSKRVDLFILLLLLTFTIDAQTINSESAKQIAESFLGKEVRESNESRHRKMARVEASIPNTPAIYFFNATDGKGFVIVSGDEGATTPVLAYSKNGVFDIDNVPEAALLLISQYTKSIETLSKSNSKEHGVSKTKALPSTEGSANPLLSTQWDQGSPYNDECPVLNGSHALTGCVATAMAQVINYEMKSNRVKSINGYDTEDGYHVEDLPARDFDFGNLDNDGIAHLMRYCGQSVRMNYGLEKSGAHSEYIPEALHEYFGWESQIGVLKRENYNEEHWNRIISEEITAGHPLIYSAHTEAGDGHTFVVDGYADGFYHVNWGWGGLSDGYYSFSLFSSENRSDYILMQEIVTTRDDDPSNDVITYGTTINGINYQLQDDFTAIVLPLKDGEKYKGEIVIPSSVEYEGKKYTVNYLGQNVFVNCKHLTSISIPASIIGQEWSIFDGCENLHKVNVEDLSSFIKLDVGGWRTGSPFTYGADLYLNGEIVKDLVIPEGIESVGYCKFAKCTSIESVTMPSTMKVAGTYSFSNCPNLKTIDMLGSSLELIDELAFVNDAALQEIRLPVTLKTIRREAFGGENGIGCISLRKVVCMAPTPPFRDGDGNAFSMRVLSDVDLYVPDDAVQLYQKAKEWRQFVAIAPLSQEKPLPQTDTVTVDGLSYEINITERYAKILGPKEGFDGNAIIPASINYNNESYPVEVIGYEAFYGQTLYDVDIPSHVRRVGIRSFMGAKVDSEIKLPDSLKYIPEEAFGDLKVPKLILGKYVECIGENAFSSEDFFYDWSTEMPIPEIECRSLVPPVIEENSFDSHQFANSVLTIPYGSKKAYAIADGWSNFNSIFNIGSVQEETLAHDLSLSASIQGRSSLQEGMSLKIKGTITNRGEQSVNGFNIIWDVDGVSVGSIAVDSVLQPKELYDFNISIPFNDIKAGSHILGLATSLNNDVMDDDINDNLKSLSFSTFDDGYYRVSLIEQFTSEECGLTPSANPKVFNAIENTDNSDFVAHVFNHCGYYDDFLTLNRDYEWFYNEGYGTYTPAVMLNRTDVAGTGYTPVMNVSEGFELNLINENRICDAMVSVFLEMNDDNACVKIVLTKTPNFDITEGYDYITVFLIEDSILARQQRDVWSDGYLENYYHRHVLRKVLSSTWGEPIQWKTDKSFCMFDTELNQEWKKENLSAVAFIHRYNPLSQTNCQVYTAGASNLPQYIELPDNFFDLAVKMYTLTYMVDGETYKTYEVEYGASITPEDEPTKEGYTFSGWSEIPETMPAKDVTVTGSFTFIDAIVDVIADDENYQIYTLDGKPIETLQKGVNIIRYTDGKVTKVLVK